MTQYRRKPQLIEAFQWTGGIDQNEDPVWAVEAIREGTITFQDGMICMWGKHGGKRPSGTWVLLIGSELRFLDPSEFLALYEPA
jgi:hypothetical protein